MATIFFSWQSDTPANITRSIIEAAIREAISQLEPVLQFEDAPRELEFDKDTQGEPGTPEVLNTIFSKIDQAFIYVADLTFTSQRAPGEYSPNPNVLIEYGRAIKAVGHKRIICLMNSSFGEPNEKSLPFNMRHLRWPKAFHLSADMDAAEKSKAKKDLTSFFTMAIDTILKKVPFEKPPVEQLPSFVALDKRRSYFRDKGEALGVPADYFATKDELQLVDQPRTWLRLIPVFEQQRQWLTTDIRDKIYVGGSKTIADFQTNTFRSQDGFGLYAFMNDMPGFTNALSFGCKTGEVWSIDAYLVDAFERHGGNAPFLEPHLPVCLEGMFQFAEKLGVRGPYKWVAGVEGIKGKRMKDDRGYLGEFRGTIGPSVVDAVIVEGPYDPAAGAARSLEPFFVQLWDSFGAKR